MWITCAQLLYKRCEHPLPGVEGGTAPCDDFDLVENDDGLAHLRS